MARKKTGKTKSKPPSRVKKTTTRTTSRAASTATVSVVPKAKANYGANERPRACPKCKNTASEVCNTYTYQSPERKVRRRKCGFCGQIYSTNEVFATL